MKTPLLLTLIVACTAFLSAQSKPWEEKKIYASSGSGENKNMIVTVNAFFAPNDTATLSGNGGTFQSVHWDKKTMKAEVTQKDIPSNVGKFISDLKKKPVDSETIENNSVKKYTQKRDEYIYSIDMFFPYIQHELILQSFGRAFFVPEFEKPVSVLRVSVPDASELEIRYCALEARKGQLPVFYYDQKGYGVAKLGLVSLETGKLKPLGTWGKSPSLLREGPIAWIDDNTLALIDTPKGAIYWGVFDIDKKAVVAEAKGEWGDDGEISDFIIKDGRFYGYLRENITQLYPVISP